MLNNREYRILSIYLITFDFFLYTMVFRKYVLKPLFAVYCFRLLCVVRHGRTGDGIRRGSSDGFGDGEAVNSGRDGGRSGYGRVVADLVVGRQRTRVD